jgi:hypothetical protein
MSVYLPPRSEEELMGAALDRTVAAGKLAADRVMEQFKKNNLVRFAQSGANQQTMLMQSIWVHSRLRAVEIPLGADTAIVDVLNLCISGDIETAAYVISQMVPDDMSMPYHFLSAEVLGELVGLIVAEMP